MYHIGTIFLYGGFANLMFLWTWYAKII